MYSDTSKLKCPNCGEVDLIENRDCTRGRTIYECWFCRYVESFEQRVERLSDILFYSTRKYPNVS